MLKEIKINKNTLLRKVLQNTSVFILMIFPLFIFKIFNNLYSFVYIGHEKIDVIKFKKSLGHPYSFIKNAFWNVLKGLKEFIEIL